MKFTSPLAVGSVALVSSALVRNWMGTLDYAALYADPAVDPVHPGYRGSKIYVFWHENILFPLALRGHCRIAMLLSRHDDANVLGRVAGMMGFDTIRGSTFHGGAVVLRQLAERARDRNLAITPDGPRGPRRSLAPGCIYLAGSLGIPIVAMGFGYDRPWRLTTWDQFAIPRPFSRARAIVSRPIFIPAGLDREGLEDHRLGLERLLTRLSEEAEDWAWSGCRLSGQVRAARMPSKTARWAAAIGGPAGVPLPEEIACWESAADSFSTVFPASTSANCRMPGHASAFV